MKNSLFLPVYLLLFFGYSCNGAVPLDKTVLQSTVVDTSQVIKNIKAQYAAINAGSFVKKKNDLTGLSAEGGEVTSYHNKNGVVKDHVILYGEMGKVEMDLYYNEQGLFFEYKKETSYDRPIYVKGSKLKSVTEDRYYFHKNAMIRWIATSRKIVLPTSSKFKEESSTVLDLAGQIEAQRK